jgi:hypothetical protein
MRVRGVERGGRDTDLSSYPMYLMLPGFPGGAGVHARTSGGAGWKGGANEDLIEEWRVWRICHPSMLAHSSRKNVSVNMHTVYSSCARCIAGVYVDNARGRASNSAYGRGGSARKRTSRDVFAKERESAVPVSGARVAT